MRGPKLAEIIASNSLALPGKTTLEDFETLYSLALGARGLQEGDAIPELDETLILGFLCRIDLPGKQPSFRDGICALLSNFAGVATNANLQQRFVSKLSPRLLKAHTTENLPVKNIRGFLKQG